MIKLYNSILIIGFLIFASNGFSQKREMTYEMIQQKVEEFAEQFEIEMDYADFIDILYYYYQNPLNLNSATDEQLRSMGLLNDSQIASLLEYRQKKGNFETIYELKDIPGFDYLIAYQLQMFFYVGKVTEKQKLEIKPMLSRGRHDVITRYSRILEEQNGFIDTTDSRYKGSRDKLYLRYRYTYRNVLSYGFLGEKDAGEEFLKGSNKAGFDFYSAHVFLKTEGIVKAVALGDYHLEFGQGLTLWSGLGFGKSVDAMGTQKGARGLRPNTSANENLFFRGGAIALQPIDPLTITLFYSHKKLDAGLETDTLNAEETYFTSIQESGLHRTENEIGKENSISEQIMGGNAKFNHKRLSIGATAYYTSFDKPLFKQGQLYQIYDFQGKENINAGLDFSYHLNKVGFFGEAAISKNQAIAGIAGIVADVHPRIKMTLLYRYYSPEYQVFYATPFAEASGAHNEEGLYLGLRLYVGKSSSINAYYDLFSFPWMRFRIDGPSHGNEFMVDYSKQIQRDFKFYVRLKSETKMLNQSSETNIINILQPVQKQSLRLNFAYNPQSNIRLQTRVEAVKYQHQPDEAKFGYLFFQDVKYRPNDKPFDISFRYALFNTDTYDTRIYAYESDVLYKFSIPGYYYQGQRYYLMFHWDVTQRIDFWMRFSQTAYFDRNTIGSGQDEIDGNKKSEITAQMRFKF